jgi:hypothetical protein
MRRKGYTLEAAWTIVPTFVEFDPYFNTSEDHLLSPFEINPQLHNISIIDWKRLRLSPW